MIDPNAPAFPNEQRSDYICRCGNCGNDVTFNDVTMRSDKNDAEIARLRKALQKYGRHEETCPIVDEAGDSFCTCGFSAALGGAK